ncbi:hypothetical protein LINPERPRIM_LOCUS32320 [Linum perenne]
MAGTEQKQLLALIRDFASEKSQGERRVTGLKKRNQELQSEIKTENEELDKTKRLKETAENNFKGYEVKLAILDGSFQTLEVRFICSLCLSLTIIIFITVLSDTTMCDF